MGTTYDVVAENKGTDTLRVVDLDANATRTWRRSEFLSRGLIVEEKPR